MSILSLIMGIGITASQGSLYANVTGVGSTVFHTAAPAQIAFTQPLMAAQAGANFVFGILLIVLGFFIHGLVRARDERHVHITVKPSKKRRASWFWMEMRV
jgi:hypothetical protein